MKFRSVIFSPSTKELSTIKVWDVFKRGRALVGSQSMAVESFSPWSLPWNQELGTEPKSVPRKSQLCLTHCPGVTKTKPIHVSFFVAQLKNTAITWGAGCWENTGEIKYHPLLHIQGADIPGGHPAAGLRFPDHHLWCTSSFHQFMKLVLLMRTS